MPPEEVVAGFNACINAGDADGLGRLMTDDHAFIDSEAATVRGKAECLDAWRGFFAQFPDYRNVFVQVQSHADHVVVRGYSTCSHAALDGPALWSARISSDKVTEWRVYEDSAANRAQLGVA